MIPAGYMAKNISTKPDWLKVDGITDIYSVSGCVSVQFADYVQFWKHNGYWFFDTPEIIEQLARDNAIDISSVLFFYYEVYEKQYDERKKTWIEFMPEPSFATSVRMPETKQLEGYDVVSFSVQTSPECSPLSCNGLARSIPVNRHCLMPKFEEARRCLESGKLDNSEPGPFRIFAVYSVPKPHSGIGADLAGT
jgi:hypothetical protein